MHSSFSVQQKNKQNSNFWVCPLLCVLVRIIFQYYFAFVFDTTTLILTQFTDWSLDVMNVRVFIFVDKFMHSIRIKHAFCYRINVKITHKQRNWRWLSKQRERWWVRWVRITNTYTFINLVHTSEVCNDNNNDCEVDDERLPHHGKTH